MVLFELDTNLVDGYSEDWRNGEKKGIERYLLGSSLMSSYAFHVKFDDIPNKDC